MSQIIDSYQQDLIENLNQASEKISGTFQSKQDWKDLRAMLTQCQKGIKLIQTQLVGQPSSLRAGKSSKLRQHRKKFDQLKKATFEKQNNWQLDMNKKQLMGNRCVSNQVIKSYDKSTQATERLRQSVQVMYQNLQISENVGNELSDQTNKLIGTKNKVIEIRHDLNKSERKIKSMMLRVKKNKFILGGILAFILLVLIIVLVSYFK